eukprot:CAMPEP_0175904816 /NCGR_PEP_ID=MMETSP0108-20121206/4676_1 /TAXON_ID=195067 ORGANISM="Goniomonas pacifica, Strain CCMP1869" /NCGR_SAMPLE_ID=MMETSP0108 /ASSEMBLY_ACC=CAM_ASM_000204 /LENGTH=35 /DNA_ID= /DNA_START= /DNA_END= /DNA_ORIENTATION=
MQLIVVNKVPNNASLTPVQGRVVDVCAAALQTCVV